MHLPAIGVTFPHNHSPIGCCDLHDCSLKPIGHENGTACTAPGRARLGGGLDFVVYLTLLMRIPVVLCTFVVMQVRLRLLVMEGNDGLEEQPPAEHGT